MTVLIKDGAQAARVNRPTDFGMNPEVAERLQSFGIDPRSRAEEVRRTFAQREGRRARRMLPRVDAAPITSELSIDYHDVQQRELLQVGAMEAVDPDFIAEEIAPTEFVDVMQGTVPLDDQVEDRRQVNDDASEMGAVREVKRNQSLVNIDLEEHAIQDYQGRRSQMLAPQLASVSRMVEKTSRKGKLQHEIRVMTAVTTATNYAAANRRALTGGYEWNGGASARPIVDMQTMMAAMFAPPTHAVMSLEMWQAAQINVELREILGAFIANKGVLSVEDFALFFGIPNVIVDEQRYTAIGASTLSRLYPSGTLALLAVNASPQSRTFLRNYMFRQGAGGYSTLAWFDAGLGSYGSDRVKIAWANDLVVPDNTYGAILTGGRA